MILDRSYMKDRREKHVKKHLMFFMFLLSNSV